MKITSVRSLSAPLIPEVYGGSSVVAVRNEDGAEKMDDTVVDSVEKAGSDTNEHEPGDENLSESSVSNMDDSIEVIFDSNGASCPNQALKVESVSNGPVAVPVDTKDNITIAIDQHGKFSAKETENEIEALGLYSGKPCCSNSPTAQLPAPLPIQLPKIENESEEDEDEVEDGGLEPNDVLVPKYTVTDSNVLGTPMEIIVIEDGIQSVYKPSNGGAICFNCGDGTHLINQCPRERDQAQIEARLKSFRATRGQGQNQTASRYHEPALEERYKNHKPGTLSRDLRRVMGLADNRLPSHIYKMREYGYPPGWFENAMEAPSGLKFYGVDDVRQSTTLSRLDRLKPEKLPNYPGYTTPVPSGFKDETFNYGAMYTESSSIPSIVGNWKQQVLSEQTGPIRRTSKGDSFTRSHYSGQNDPMRLAGDQFLRRDNPVRIEQNRKPWTEIKWYDGIFDSPHVKPTSSATMTDMNAIEDVYRKSRNPYGKFLATSTSSYTGPRNYRVTEELERLAKRHETRSQEDSGYQAFSHAKKRPRSPSLLSPEHRECYSATSSHRSNLATGTRTDDYAISKEAQISSYESNSDVEIVEADWQPTKRSKMTTIETINIDDDEADVTVESKGSVDKAVYVRNPLYFRRKLNEREVKVNLQGISSMKPSHLSAEKPTIVKQEMKPQSLDPPKATCSATVTSCTAAEVISIDSSSCSSEDSNKAVTSSPPRSTSEVFDGQTVRDRIVDVFIRHNRDSFEERPVYLGLPPVENFSKDMSELPLQDVAVEFSGRLDKVLGIIKRSRDGSRESPAVQTSVAEDVDDDIQILT